MTISINNTTFAESLSRTDSKLFDLKQRIDDILSDFEIAMNLSKHTGNICIIRRLKAELEEIKERIDDYQEDELSLIILKLIDEDNNEVIDESFENRDKQITLNSYKSL